jgi:MFS family permease
MGERRNVAVLTATIVCTVGSLYAWNRVLSLYLSELGAGPEAIGWSFFFLVLAYRLPQVAGGLLTDRVGRKVVVVVGTLAMSAGFVGIAFAPRWELVVAAICACWTIGALQWPALATLVTESVPEGRRGLAMGLMEAGSMAGIMLGPLVGERVVASQATLGGAWRVLLLGSCAVYAVSGLLRAALLREPSVHAEERGRLVFPWRDFLLPAVVTILSFWAFLLTTDGPVMGLYIRDVAKGTPVDVQRVAFHGGACALAGALLAGWLVDRLGAGRTMMLTSFATLALLVPFAAGRLGPEGELRIFALLFLPGETFVVAYQKLITSLAPRERRGLAVGLMGTCVGLASSWANAAAGYLYAGAPRWPIVAGAAIQAAACLLSIALLRRRYS